MVRNGVSQRPGEPQEVRHSGTTVVDENTSLASYGLDLRAMGALCPALHEQVTMRHGEEARAVRMAAIEAFMQGNIGFVNKSNETLKLFSRHRQNDVCHVGPDVFRDKALHQVSVDQAGTLRLARRRHATKRAAYATRGNKLSYIRQGGPNVSNAARCAQLVAARAQRDKIFGRDDIEAHRA